MKKWVCAALCTLLCCVSVCAGATLGSRQIFAPGNIVTFGVYEQDNNLRNGPEPIEWIVLGCDDDSALLLARYGLDAVPYDNEERNVTWETSSIRRWLNTEFISRAFSAKECGAIYMIETSTPDNREHGTDGGRDTQDAVILLSIEELDWMIEKKADRTTKPTEYAYRQGVTKDKNGRCWWWLRSPGKNAQKAAHANFEGGIFADGTLVNNARGAVRPAIMVDLNAPM